MSRSLLRRSSWLGWAARRGWLVGLASALLAAAAWTGRGAEGVAASQAGAGQTISAEAGDRVCAGCHQAIYASYERTSMAQGSGRLGAGGGTLVPGEFAHASSGILYRVFTRDGDAWMSYDRGKGASGAEGALQMFDLEHPATAQAAGALHGERRLEYFIGSGKHGRTYLYQVAGTWFELPINYYTRRAGWGMAPAFDQAATMPSNLPADPNCLFCHTTGVGAVTPGSRSHYPGAPFAQGGVGCTACHGDPSAHLAARGHGGIVNPGKLDARRRESACLACHLEGDALVYRAGKSLAQFKAGEDFAATAVVFVRANRESGGGRAASQYEALLRSACRRAVGDRLTCTSCHDPHATPSPEERVAYYRGKCLACHTGVAMATTHHPEQQDCATCHMPTRATTDISHEQTVDHDIERVPAPASPSAARTGETLVPVGGWKSSDRELGLAYAQMAARGDRKAGERALALLSASETAGASDAVLHAQMGFLRQMRDERDQAREEYLAALRQDPYEARALGNLAVLAATTGHLADAVGLLDRLIAADPTETAAGLNLAFIACRLGEIEKARGTLATLARYNPDDPALRTFAGTGNYGGQHCNLTAGGAAGNAR